MNTEQQQTYDPSAEVTLLANTLKVGRRYTFRRINPHMGGLEEIKATVISVELCEYAQYKNAVKVRFFRNRRKTSEIVFFYASEKYSTLPVVWEGFVAPANVIDENSVVCSNNGVSYRHKYRSTDTRYISDAVTEQPEGIVFNPSKY